MNDARRGCGSTRGRMVAVAFFRGYRRRRAAGRDDHRDLAADQIGGHVGQLVVLARSPAVFDRDTPALNKAGVGKSLPEGCDALGVAVG